MGDPGRFLSCVYSTLERDRVVRNSVISGDVSTKAALACQDSEGDPGYTKTRPGGEIYVVSWHRYVESLAYSADPCGTDEWLTQFSSGSQNSLS